MQNSEKQCSRLAASADTADNTQKVKVWLTPSQCEFIDFVLFYGASELSKSLRIVHDLALYHSDVAIGVEEKRALFGVRCLGKELKKPL